MSLPFQLHHILCPEPSLRADEELGHSREVLDLLKSKVVTFKCVIFQFQDGSAYPLWLDYTQIPLDSVSSPFSRDLYSVYISK